MSRTLDTFDVFDTLLTRAVGDPASVFLLLGRMERTQQLTGCGPEQFARLRITAEKRARAGRIEVTLDEIYTELAAGLVLPPGAAAELVALELGLEKRLSRPVPEGRDLLSSSKADARLALSDMYLPPTFVETLLRRHDLDGRLDGVRVSSAEGATKSNGALFRAVASELRPAPGSWCHHGDNTVTDIRIPRAMGIRARPVSSAKLNRYEQLWEEYRWETGGFTSLVSGASRLARLGTSPAGSGPIVDVACGVAGPILTAYVLWVLHRARRHGLRRLYFLARDGEILWLIASRLAPRLGMDLELRYLYGSRAVYHRARLATEPLADADWAWRALYRLSGRDVLLRFGFSPHGAEKALIRLGLGDAAARPLTEEEIAAIVSDDQVAEETRSMSSMLSDRVQRYLRQEGFCEGQPYGVVDTGWAGRILRSLDEVLPEDATPLDHAFLFGSLDRPDGLRREGVVEGYLFDQRASTGYCRNFPDAYGPLETFTVANHGSTVDFAERGDFVEPVLDSPDNPALAEWPWAPYRDMVMRFVDELVLDPDVAHVEADMRSAVAAVLSAFWSQPTPAEAQTWGRFVYEDDILARSRNRLAVPIQAADFVQKASPRYEGKRLWLAGSVAISPRPVQPLARAGLWYNETRRRSRDEGLGVFLPPRWRRRAAIGRHALAARTSRGLTSPVPRRHQ